jgi:hypothetical protein
MNVLRSVDLLSVTGFIASSSSFGFPLGFGFAYLLCQPDIPKNCDDATSYDQHWEIPKSIITNASACAKNDQYPCQTIFDGLLRKLEVCEHMHHLSHNVVEPTCTAARAMIPTVLAFMPLKKAYTIGGNRSGILCTPRDRPYIPTAPGKLHNRKANTAELRPACIIAIVKTILVEPGPGRAWQMAKIS